MVRVILSHPTLASLRIRQARAGLCIAPDCQQGPVRHRMVGPAGEQIARLDADASSPDWERMVCLGELASIGKPGEGPDASGIDCVSFSASAHRSYPSPFGVC